MEIMIITGFLGSGKTTLLKYIADEFIRINPEKKMAIIENEVGKAGIDGQFLKGSGLYIREINSGCICCSLRVDFITTLLELERSYNPDLVILEPSGVAAPRQMVATLNDYGGNISSKRIVCIIDASRMKYIPDITIPIISDGINVSDFTVINKIDLVDGAELEDIKSKLQTIRPDIEIIEVAAEQGINADAVVRRILCDDYQAKTITAAVDNCSVAVNNPAVFSEEFDITLAEGQTASGFTATTADTIASIAEKLEDAGCSVIGHLKAALSNDGGDCAFISTTSFKHPPHIKGAITGENKQLRLKINAIVYDVDKNTLKEIICGICGEIAEN